jgi:hypothetical protein
MTDEPTPPGTSPEEKAKMMRVASVSTLLGAIAGFLLAISCVGISISALLFSVCY